MAAVLVVLSPTFGRAVPTGEYRPPLPPDALTNGCYPLPEGVTFDFSYQVRSDGDQGGRRHLVLQYNLIDEDEAVTAVTDAFTRAGFRALGGLRLVRGDVVVDGRTRPMDPLTDDQIVRGTIELDLPVVERRSDDPVCSDVESTKRFAQDVR